MSIKKFKANDWIVYWAGGFSLLSDSYFGKKYMVKPFLQGLEQFVSQVAFIYKDGLTTACIRKSEKIEFGNKVKKLISSNELSISQICESLKEKTDSYLEIIDRDEGKDVSWEEYREFIDALYEYYVPHIMVKNILDVFSDKEMEKYAKMVEEARVYAEPVFTRSEEYMDSLVKIISEKTGYENDMILAMLSNEFENYLKTGKLPEKNILIKRHQESVLTFDQDKREIWLDSEAAELKKIILGDEESDVIDGETAYGGKVQGTVRIILDSSKVSQFNDGDILVAESTRPDYLPLLKKAAAIVTDAGGILCHAAIVAREMKKSCLIGTKIASKAFKDGDKVEVDADKGIVRKLL